MEQLSFDMSVSNHIKIKNSVRLIELFAGVGSQAMALRDLGVDFEHYRVVEFDRFAIASYNAIHGTDFPTMDITQVGGYELGITDTDKYTYIMTYSFPCQDLSVAGKGRGMTKGSGTRSGLLWEVERLLNEVEELPQILLMENVPQVIGKKNRDDFNEWMDFLKGKGYTNRVEILNAKDYGVAQNRQRCFMVSMLGDYEYIFPKPIPLLKRMKDYLEEWVEEKFYLKSEKADKLIEQLIVDGKLENSKGGQTLAQKTQDQKKSQIAYRQEPTEEFQDEGQRVPGYMNYKKVGQIDVSEANTIMARDYKGFGGSNELSNGVIEN